MLVQSRCSVIGKGSFFDVSTRRPLTSIHVQSSEAMIFAVVNTIFAIRLDGEITGILGTCHDHNVSLCLRASCFTFWLEYG